MQRVSENIGIDKMSLEKMLDFLPYPFLVSEFRDGAQYNIFVNRKFVEEIGYTCKEIPTLGDWFMLAYPNKYYRNEVMFDWSARVKAAKEAGEDSVTKQARIHTKEKGLKWYEVKASVFGQVNFVAFIDIDKEIVREQDLERLNENKNRTLSILSHDLRSPLNNLLSVLELTADNNLTEVERTEMLKKITTQVYQMRDFLDTTLQWSKVNFAEIKVTIERISVKPIIEKLVELYRSAIDEKNISITVNVDVENPVWSDKEILDILIRNFLSNAIKYTPHSGWIKITGQPRGEKYVVTVKNSGKGISDEKIEMIKNKNAISERGTNGEKGLGLGLKLCQHLLETIEGTLEIENLDSKITVFKIII
jgi:signal transduction histidine kinase